MIHFDTSDFEFSHQKRPRGYGSWAFFFDNSIESSTAFFFLGAYTEAKQAAVAEARRRGASVVHVGA